MEKLNKDGIVDWIKKHDVCYSSEFWTKYYDWVNVDSSIIYAVANEYELTLVREHIVCGSSSLTGEFFEPTMHEYRRLFMVSVNGFARKLTQVGAIKFREYNLNANGDNDNHGF